MEDSKRRPRKSSMSQEPIYTARPIEEEQSIHPLEEVMRLIGRDAPRPFFPAEYLHRSRVNPDHLSAVLDHLTLEGLIAKVPARSMESGSGVVLTRLGEQVLADPALMSRLIRGDALREGDVGAVIRKGMRTRVKPYVTYALIAANVIIAVLGMVNPAAWSWPYQDKPGAPVKVGSNFKAWEGDAALIARGEWWRLMTCTFLHGGLLHLGCNMFSLYSLGAFVEQAWGRWRMLVIYLVAGWAGSCLGVQYAHSLVGASGAVCGLLGAVAVWFVLYRKHIPREFASRGLWQVVISVALIAFMGLMIPNVSNAGHLGGGIGGAAAALVLHLQRFGLPGASRRTPALRWAIATPLLLLLPAASYVQLKKPWGHGKSLVRKDEKADEEVSKELVKKGEKLDREEGAAFYKDFGEGLGTDVLLAHVHLYTMPKRADKAEVAKKLAQIKEDRAKVSALRARLAEASYDNGPVERMRKEGLAFADRMLELQDLAEKYLNGPADATSTKLNQRYNAFVDPFEAYVEKLKELAPKD
jgi:membrane associated rhomboid family serine protease